MLAIFLAVFGHAVSFAIVFARRLFRWPSAFSCWLWRSFQAFLKGFSLFIPPFNLSIRQPESSSLFFRYWNFFAFLPRIGIFGGCEFIVRVNCGWSGCRSHSVPQVQNGKESGFRYCGRCCRHRAFHRADGVCSRAIVGIGHGHRYIMWI